MTSVSLLGHGNFAVNTGDRVLLLSDTDRNGKINEGDVYVLANQAGASVLSGVIGSKQATCTWGDPHIHDRTFSDTAETQVAIALDNVLQDVQDGSLDNIALLQSVDVSLMNHETSKYVGDYHADVRFRLIDGKTLIDQDVVESDWRSWEGETMYVTDNVDIHVGGRTITVREVWGCNGGAGQMAVADTTTKAEARAVVSADDLTVIDEMDGANVRVDVTQFGEGTTGSAVIASKESFILDAKGSVQYKNGEITSESLSAFVTAYENGARWLGIVSNFRAPTSRADSDDRVVEDPRRNKNVSADAAYEFLCESNKLVELSIFDASPQELFNNFIDEADCLDIPGQASE